MKGDQTRVSPLYTCASSPVHSQQLTPCRSPPRFLFTRRLQVYRTLTIDELKRRLSCLSLPFSGVEKVILRAVRRHYLNVRIDYRFNCLRFETGNFEVERTQKQLTQLGSNLKKVADSLAGPERTAPTTASPKAALIANMRATIERDHSDNLARKVLIERMKEEREKRQLEAKRKRIYQQKMAEREAKLAERERLAQEKARRAEERQARIKAQEEFQRKRDLAAKMNLNMNDQQLKELTGEELLKQRQQEEIEKHRKLQKKMRAQSNHVDYFCRAIRENERGILDKHIKAKMDEEEKRFRADEKKAREKHLKAWEHAIAEKERTSRMLPLRDSYTERLFAVRRERLSAERERMVMYARLKKRKAKLERAKKRHLEAKQRVEAERVRQEQLKIEAEEAAIRAEEEERKRQDEEGGWRRASADPRNRARDRLREQQRREPPTMGSSRDSQDRGSDRDRYSSRGSSRFGTNSGGGGGAYRPPGRRDGGSGYNDSGGYGGRGGYGGGSGGSSGGGAYRPPGRRSERDTRQPGRSDRGRW